MEGRWVGDLVPGQMHERRDRGRGAPAANAGMAATTAASTATIREPAADVIRRGPDSLVENHVVRVDRRRVKRQSLADLVSAPAPL